MRLSEAGPKIELTAKERDVFGLLREVVDEAKMGTVMRAAGGWVRDKLLGKDSKDIDIALDNMKGLDFAEAVNKHMKAKAMETHKIGEIRANPDQSKHLETATMKIMDMWIDLVNLRAESYAEGSRIPDKMEFGTPLQDAERRDLTINALFYNINEDCVEDFTTKGLDDLRDGIIRTPLPPRQTFLDDPLRVLRAIRFCARFGYRFADEVPPAIMDPVVLEALSKKVSRERVGIELSSMLEGARPALALQLLASLGVADAIFTLPQDVASPPNLAARGVTHAQNLLTFLERDDTALAGEQRRQAMLAAMLLPLRDATYTEKKRQLAVAGFVVKSSLKLKSKDAEVVECVHAAVGEFHALLTRDLDSVLSEGMPNGDVARAPRTILGRVLRKVKEEWGVALRLAASLEMEGAPGVDVHPRYDALRRKISELGLAEGPTCAWVIKPLLRGDEISKEFGVPKGKELGPLVERCVEWQMAHPEGDAAALRVWLGHILKK